MTDVDDLLAAPRGRGLCAALAWAEGNVFGALDIAVANAAYWQAPHDIDEHDPMGVRDYRPIAEHILRSPGIAWWRSAVAFADQWYVDLLHDGESESGPVLAGAAAGLRKWAADRRAPRAELPPGVDPWEVSGIWWSTPVYAPGVIATARSQAGHEPVGLSLVEDGMGWGRARCWPVAPGRRPTVYEVGKPADWGDLARRYPLDVTESHAPDWRRATGRIGRWVIPDWSAVAADYDAVHVSVWGYLTTAGRPVAIDDATATLLAGWSPDVTYWLTECLEVTGPPIEWAWVDDAWTAGSTPLAPSRRVWLPGGGAR